MIIKLFTYKAIILVLHIYMYLSASMISKSYEITRYPKKIIRASKKNSQQTKPNKILLLTCSLFKDRTPTISSISIRIGNHKINISD